jgi:hypothetical protein
VNALASVDSSDEPRKKERRRLLVGIITVHLLWCDVCSCQRGHGVFGPAIDFPLRATPAGLFLSNAEGGRLQIELITSDPPAVNAYVLARSGDVESRSSTTLHSRCRSWLVTDLEAHGSPDLLALTPEADTLVLARRRAPGLFQETRIPLDVRPQGLVIADINHDHRREILLYGKSMAGIQVLTLRPDGVVVRGPLLLPDVSASAVAVTDLNGDGIPDIFVANWLSNQVGVFFGIARYVFSEQVTIELEGEPEALALTPVTKRRTVELAVLLPATRSIAVFSGNAAGEFRRTATIASPLTPRQAEFMELNGDAWPDLVVASEQGLQTVLATSANGFEHAVVYGLGNTLDLWRIADLDGDGRAELVCGDRSGRRLIIASRGDIEARAPSVATYLAGERPQGVMVTDLDGDGRQDIVVANQGSSSVSCFLNLGGGHFAPQATIGIPERPSTVRAVDGEPRRFLVAHGGEGKLSVVSTGEWNAPRVFSIPTAADPVVLRALHRKPEEPLRLLVRSRGGAQASATFSLFEQLTGRNFLEKTFTTLLPTAFRGITAASFSAAKGSDLIFLTADRSGNNYTLSYASAGTDFNYRDVRPLFTFTDSLASFRAVQVADVDGDGLEDVLLLGDGSARGAGVLYARTGGGFDSTLSRIDGLVPRPGGRVLVQDVDGDNIPDFVAINNFSQTVRVVYGSGRRQFSPPRDIAPAANVFAFDVGSLLQANSHDLVIANEDRGTVSVFLNPFAR